ncbi:hypothetical protein C4K35_1111 [Pseudomonas chlororaphis subsp. piscium]|nr:hypothetical protein C4K35_1111 [Pseudomonas chlororaphis subsp. piscium]AZC55280.1 hypothetical protein C4K34_1096 [Pseudomonas chlororaphis subsp. piscium]AZC61600.1 hypothetical protein C4K33_1089 [Pseudomonas chlororaphis subsp. piscium]AZC74028.1 hypothetical protein C4K31_1106 [Pseudomonas chlororaphis subsp. piscium]AZC87428.1 hypothetical protein C4K29_1107 [Pseudomonas chlororaphis subsp. piscium]
MLHRSELLWSNTQGCGFGAGVARGGSEACQKRAEQGRSRWVGVARGFCGAWVSGSIIGRPLTIEQERLAVAL